MVAGLVLAAFSTRAAAQVGPYQFYSLTPCRLADTRLPTPGNPPAGGPILTDNTTRNFKIQGWCNIPVGAKAATLNVTALSPTSTGHLRVYPAGTALPLVSTINFNAGELAIANGAIVPLADQATNPLDLAVFARVPTGGTVHVILDVTGYFQ